MSIWLADVNGLVVQAIIKKNFAEFVKRVRHQQRVTNFSLLDLKSHDIRRAIVSG
jgi:hypothetical protein